MKWGEFWLAELDGIGSEQTGVRPVIIVSNDIGNRYATTVTICPITTKVKNFNATHICVNNLAQTSFIMAEQVRTIDKSRLKRYICKINPSDSLELKKKLILALGL
jgi:mRNA interferase MazF